MKRCVPFRAPCGSEDNNLFLAPSAPESSLPSGIISVVNTGSDCDITISVTEFDSGVAVDYTIIPQSSVVIEVSELVSIIYSCVASTGTGDFCTGTFEADLQYTVMSS
ncbi:hypothetical protein [Pontibacillus halophilus]|uniref:hypothetical protein n=1 Tax=Pontibacillus halophilus TaxID=516704 RepID=UPI0038B274D6